MVQRVDDLKAVEACVACFFSMEFAAKWKIAAKLFNKDWPTNRLMP